ncbi:MAG TPA: integrase core domain-containing protein [Myxococcota bacterium]|nr:integrase core domain-containing protein [Myxococcota bacterium]
MKALRLVLTVLFNSLRALGRSRSDLLLENVALRQQINALIQAKPLPRLQPEERMLWVALRRTWNRWQDALLVVQPETVVAWHRKAFQRYWTALSRAPGRPRLAPDVRELIVQMASENATWGAPSIHGELAKLGFSVSERTVSRYLPRIRPGRGVLREWGTFLRNHREVLAAMDFFMVPTVTWFLIRHGRRKIVHFDITEHPTAPWVVQQLRESFPYDSAPSYLVFDRDSIFSQSVISTIQAMGIEPKRIAARSPWQNGVAERWIGSCRRELLDRVVILNERHLRRLLRDYLDYYARDRCHLALDKDAPDTRSVQPRPSARARVVAHRRLGGLHHRYAWREAT